MNRVSILLCALVRTLATLAWIPLRALVQGLYRPPARLVTWMAGGLYRMARTIVLSLVREPMLWLGMMAYGAGQLAILVGAWKVTLEMWDCYRSDINFARVMNYPRMERWSRVGSWTMLVMGGTAAILADLAMAATAWQAWHGRCSVDDLILVMVTLNIAAGLFVPGLLVLVFNTIEALTHLFDKSRTRMGGFGAGLASVWERSLEQCQR